MPSRPAVTPTQLSALSRCAAVFLPSDPPRTGRVAFWRPDGEPPEESSGDAWAGVGAAERLDIALPDADGGVTVCEIPALVVPVADAVPVLTRARTTRGTHPAASFWGAACVLALQLAARGRLLPGVSPDGYDAWRAGPFDPADVGRLRDLAAAMPPYAHAAPLPGSDPVELPDPERHVRAFLDAVADGLPRSPAAALATGAPAFAAAAAQHIPEQRAWAAEVAAGHDEGVRISLRIEARKVRAHGAAGHDAA
ncbi:ATP-dependent helicase, partial [Streptomyces lydicus]